MPKFNLTLDASQIDTFLTCPLAWYYRYHLHLRLNEFRKPAPDMGTLVHNLMDIYYNFRAVDPNGDRNKHMGLTIQVFKESNSTLKLFPDDKNGDRENFLCSRFALYVSRYIFDDYAPLPGGVELGFSHLLYEDDAYRFILEGRIDLLHKIKTSSVAYDDCFTDHKTQAKTVNWYGFTPQFKTYALVTGFQYGQYNYFGMQEDKNMALLKKGQLFRRELIYFDKALIEEWRIKLIQTFFKVAQWLETFRDEATLEKIIYDNRNDAACGGAFHTHPCSYTPICETTNWEMKQKIKGFKYAVGPVWRPW